MIRRDVRLFSRWSRKKGRRGGQRGERVFRISFPGIGGETSPRVHERRPTATHLSADAEQMHARAINEAGQCACGLIATPASKGEFALSRNFIHASVVERVRGDGRRPCSLRKWLPRGRKQQVKNRRNVPTPFNLFLRSNSH